MNIEEFVNLVEQRLSYKPDSIFSLINIEHGLLISLRRKVSDSSGKEDLIEVRFQKAVNLSLIERMEESWAIEWLQNFLLNAEIHELDEWLKVDGIQVKSPHH